MSRSVSDSSLAGRAGFVVVGNPGSRRVELFQAALNCLALPPAQVVAYADLLAGRASLVGVVRPGAIVRIESPGKDFEVERALLVAGAESAEAEGCGRLEGHALSRLTFEKGRILPSRQWYLGWCAALRLIGRQLAACPAHRLMSAPDDIALMFDKRGSHQRLAEGGVTVPRGLGPVDCYEQLLEKMRRGTCARVFVKLAHSSSASGVVAYQVGRDRHQATTTVEMVRQGGELRLYNSRRIRVYHDQREIAELIDALCRDQVHVEQWLPKAGFANRIFDLRVVVIGGRARHVVARMSRSPMTNLHLLNERGDVDAVLARIGPAAWEAARRSCEQVMECFAGSLYGGVDLLITADYRRHAILEVNAFGDLLPGVLCDGMDTYEAEILAMLAASAATEPGTASRTPAHSFFHQDTKTRSHSLHSRSQVMTFIDNTWYRRPPGVRDRISAGGVVVRLAEPDVLVALVREEDMTMFVLPKGKVEAGETLEQAARREIVEEAGLSELGLLRPLAALERLSYNKKSWLTTHYFLFATGQVEGRPTDTRHHYGVWWFPIGALPEMLWPEQQELIRSNAELIQELARQAAV